ncbi:hypothetical protein ACFZAM_24655 [Streptomyces sp. NPDC008079]|uniref:hypothetical protein n=1 Tax=Streptomyces sp. NPDC008079 TaxID=3364806 RepID=UPI0036EBA6F3
MTADAIVLDGYLDEEVAADELVDEMLLPCSVSASELTAAVLHELRPGDHVRVTGHLGLPRISDHPMWLQVLTLELLDTPPLDFPDDDARDDQADDDCTTTAADPAVPVDRDTLSDVGRLERYGPYVVWSDPDLCADTVWTEAGDLLGTAVYPDTATTLIHTHQRRAYGDI